MKMMLEINLIGNKKLKINIVQLTPEAMRPLYSIDYKLFIDTKSDMIIWSFGEFSFNEKEIKLPQIDKRWSSRTYTFEFKDELERYETLKKYYNLLSKWTLDSRIFPDVGKYITDKVILNGNYWRII